MAKSKNDILQRLQGLSNAKEVNFQLKRLAELENELYLMDKESMDFDVKEGYRTQEEANIELAKRRKKYFGSGANLT